MCNIQNNRRTNALRFIFCLRARAYTQTHVHSRHTQISGEIPICYKPFIVVALSEWRKLNYRWTHIITTQWWMKNYQFYTQFFFLGFVSDFIPKFGSHQRTSPHFRNNNTCLVTYCPCELFDTANKLKEKYCASSEALTNSFFVSIFL